MSSKLNNTDIAEAAHLHLQGIEDDLQHDLMDVCMPHDEMDDIEHYITDAFIVGAKWGAQRTINDMWHKNTEEPQECKHEDELEKL